MWNEDKSLHLSKACVWAFFALTILVCAGTPWLLHAIGEEIMVGGMRVADAFWRLLGVEYTAAVVACAALYKLHRLLANIAAERALSWDCIAVGLVLAVGAVLCWPLFWLLAAVSAFAGLILRVMKNVFAEAVRLQDESDFTI